MKIERLSQDKIRIFLTLDDLLERGIQKEDLWREIPKVHELFSEMMDQAYSELGFEATGPLAVEVIGLPAQGMVVIVTRGSGDVVEHHDDVDDDEPDHDEDMYEMEVTLEISDTILYAFRDFEDVVAACRRLAAAVPESGGRLYAYKGLYLLAFGASEVDPSRYQAITAVLAEYGEAASVTEVVLEE
ncbi:MAG: adaptor protein [Thermobacillus sp. ZCTH02-B1]|uniref:genetic competence negative regulator n=1 Tax=Thermobacillus sp. ZCTH02-B1 TaxID=1858795 RepID=UPI000B553F2F|nr:genetic competence negative regulator [Thermobacillus sp. ZCTH02-B1]OUM96809.1 MAG: adaptor protein [Thermobacillus sp. ZCTH02-B1]